MVDAPAGELLYDLWVWKSDEDVPNLTGVRGPIGDDWKSANVLMSVVWVGSTKSMAPDASDVAVGEYKSSIRDGISLDGHCESNDPKTVAGKLWKVLLNDIVGFASANTFPSSTPKNRLGSWKPANISCVIADIVQKALPPAFPYLSGRPSWPWKDRSSILTVSSKDVPRVIELAGVPA